MATFCALKLPYNGLLENHSLLSTLSLKLAILSLGIIYANPVVFA